MKGEQLFAVLKFIGKGVSQFVDLQEAIINAGYGASGKGIDFELSKIRKRKAVSARIRKEKQRFSSLLYKMRRDGFIEKQPDLKVFYLTRKGQEKYADLKKCHCCGLPSRSKYRCGKTDVLKAVVFDIPEGKKQGRKWLRSVLRNLGFKMLQKSVWVGKSSFPEDFFKDLRQIGIIKYVEIFEVVKSGSLKHEEE